MNTHGIQQLYAIGIVFDEADQEKALSIFLANIDHMQVASCLVLAGDTEATLNSQAREYCIALLGGFDPHYVRRAMAPHAKRFVKDLLMEPVFLIGDFDGSGIYRERSMEEVKK